MKSFIILLSLVTFLFSCKKTTIDNKELVNPPNINYTASETYSDSCTYTIDGITFSCNKLRSNSGSLSGTNFNLSTLTWSPNDTAMYSEGYSIDNVPSYNADIEINFAERRFIPNYNTIFLPIYPRNDSSFYKIRSFGYATDFKRFNTKEGVAIRVKYVTPSYNGYLYSYSIKAPWQSSLVKDTCQNNSTFRITKTFKQNSLNYVEAVFSANFYTVNEVEKKITNGFIRFSYL
jgi:hypothetical protein